MSALFRSLLVPTKPRALRALGAMLSIWLLTAGNVTHAEELNCPNFPEPSAKVQWVAPYMLFNGLPMSIKRFDSEQSPEAILNFYRKVWVASSSGTAAVENDVEPWQTIGVVRGRCFFTVQVKPAGKGSTGMLSATQATDKPRVISAEKVLPMMSGSSIINDIDHVDDGKTARTVILSNTFSAQSNADFYQQSLKNLGWQTVTIQQVKTAKGPGITLVMKRKLAETSFVITTEGKNTIVLANLVDQP